MQSMHFVQFVREYLRIFKYNGSCSLLDGLQPLGLPVEDDGKLVTWLLSVSRHVFNF